ncbi:MAG: sulfide/dihydroorotate dehydrogenase-like FAD/NAD-binding protein [Clostridia bacterium]|nr:sulfide/dihydroorotate dehydrogenase-like FAD/NAD-binding protein [Clostridia bacterium]MBR0088320.1 sulfide/dihydroorotate dehydrogenase-like FAD/NAD-binding protein [Clostridia bacterium]MBR0469749.1 sulfide/dihydroorotate dehydrogenase-like FAD/NAD-binding protein [Clostridia bacterium]
MAYKVVRKEMLNPTVFLMEVEAPLIAKKAEPGQFIILRIDEYGERVPFTINDYDREKGTVTIIVQIVGKTTQDLAKIEAGEELLDFAGPLGMPTPLEGKHKVAVIGGGLGTAIAYPQAKKLHAMGADVTIITGFRNKDLVILEEECRAVSNKLIVATDDGSNGNQGFVTDMLQKEIDAGEKFDEVIAIGPLVMMKFVCKVTEKYDIPTMVSMNPVMIDGTGMCGGCRIIVDGETKFACVDGPDFDGHKVDWDSAMKRGRMFANYEKQSCDEGHCRIGRTNKAE